MSHSSELEMEKQVRNMNVSNPNLSYLSNEKNEFKSWVIRILEFTTYIYLYICRGENKNHFVQLVGICCNSLHVCKGFTKVSARRRFQSVVI